MREERRKDNARIKEERFEAENMESNKQYAKWNKKNTKMKKKYKKEE